MKKALLIAVLGGMSVVACAQSKAPAETAKPADAPAATTAPTDPKVAPGSADAKAIAAIRQLSSQVVIDKVGPAPMPGYREVVVSGQVLYVSDDGRYLMQGALLDMQTKRDLAIARYNVLMGSLKLRQASGTLTEQDLAAINALLAP